MLENIRIFLNFIAFLWHILYIQKIDSLILNYSFKNKVQENLKMLPVQFIEQASSTMTFAYLQRAWMQRHLEVISKKYKLKMSDLNLMLLVHINKDVKTAKDVAKFSELKRGNISLIVESLSCRGFINQLSVEGDRRMKRLVLTPKCEEILKECDEKIIQLLKISMEGISMEEIQQAKQVFTKMYQNITNEEKKRTLEENK